MRKIGILVALCDKFGNLWRNKTFQPAFLLIVQFQVQNLNANWMKLLLYFEYYWSNLRYNKDDTPWTDNLETTFVKKSREPLSDSITRTR